MLCLEGGTIGVPKGAGLGVEVNDDTLRRYLTARWVVE
jgi:L-alanine-DL-glutamate epimerase-like enolase superfamily enzyme